MTLVIEKPEGWGSTGCISLDSSTLGGGGATWFQLCPDVCVLK